MLCSMPRSADATRRRILNAAYLQFYRRGYGRVGVDEIAAAAKVTKRTLYYHFRSKDELLAAVLEVQISLALSTFRSWTEKLTGDPQQIVDAIFDGLKTWSAKPRWTGSGFTRLAMELADMPGHPARKAAHKHKTLVEKELVDVLRKAGIASAENKAREIALLLEGTTSLILIHGDPRYADVAATAAKTLLNSSPSRDHSAGR
jgi:AcrR family transcriptional regulator